MLLVSHIFLQREGVRMQSTSFRSSIGQSGFAPGMKGVNRSHLLPSRQGKVIPQVSRVDTPSPKTFEEKDIEPLFCKLLDVLDSSDVHNRKWLKDLMLGKVSSAGQKELPRQIPPKLMSILSARLHGTDLPKEIEKYNCYIIRTWQVTGHKTCMS